MAGQPREGENEIFKRAAEAGLAGGLAAGVAGILHEGAFLGGAIGARMGRPNEAQGLPPFELEQRRMHEDSKEAAGRLLQSGGRDKSFAERELQHASVVDREFGRHGEYYAEALKTLSRDVREESNGRKDLLIDQHRDGRLDLTIVPNNQPLYRERPEPPGSYYSNGNPYVPQREDHPRFKK